MPEPGVDLHDSQEIYVPGDDNDDVDSFIGGNPAKHTFNHRLPDGSIVSIDPLADIVKFK